MEGPAFRKLSPKQLDEVLPKLQVKQQYFVSYGGVIKLRP